MTTLEQKIEQGLTNLIDHILPELEDEDEDEDLKDNALELAQGLIVK